MINKSKVMYAVRELNAPVRRYYYVPFEDVVSDIVGYADGLIVITNYGYGEEKIAAYFFDLKQLSIDDELRALLYGDKKNNGKLKLNKGSINRLKEQYRDCILFIKPLQELLKSPGVNAGWRAESLITHIQGFKKSTNYEDNVLKIDVIYKNEITLQIKCSVGTPTTNWSCGTTNGFLK